MTQSTCKTFLNGKYPEIRIFTVAGWLLRRARAKWPAVRKPGVILLFSLAAGPALQTELPPITVPGNRHARKTPAHRSELGGETIEVPDAHTESLSRLLRHSPSITVHETGGAGTPAEFLIRGMDPIQNRYFLEGVPLTDAAYNNANASLVPLEALSGVDIYAEGVPVYLAEDGLGGAVGLKLAHDRCAGPAFGSRAGSFGYFRAYGEACLPAASAKAHVGYVQSSEDFLYFDDNGTPFNSTDDTLARRKHNGFRRVTLMPEAQVGAVKIFSLNVYGEKEIPGPVERPARGKLSQFYSVTGARHEADLGGGLRSDAHLYLRVGHDTLEGLEAFLPAQSTDIGAGAKFALRAGEWEGIAGVAREELNVGQTGKGRLSIPAGLSTSFPIGGRALSIKPAVLAHFYSYSPSGSYALASPRIGLVSRPLDAVQLRAAAGSFYRAPTLFELYGSPSGISASPGLRYEQAAKAEVGFDWDTRAVRLSYTFSASRARDLIAYVQNSQATRVAVNVGEAEVLAHELAVEGRTAWDIGARAALTFLSAKNLSDVAAQYGNELPHRPPYQTDLVLSYTRPRWSLSYELVVYGPTYWDLANAQRLGAVANHNLRAAWDSLGAGSFGLELDNLTDVISAPSSVGAFSTTDNSTGYFGYPAPGRRMYLSWRYDL